MNPILLKALVAIVPTSTLFVASAIMFSREKRLWAVLQIVGAAGMMIVVLAHVCEGLQLFPWMYWGRERSIGHYLDIFAAILAAALFPMGFIIHALKMKRA